MFQKILIANRGEVAIRIMQTCRRLKIPTVVVYSEADAQSHFVAESEEAMYIGPAAAQLSYLSIPNILEAAKKSGADAIHPGFGFLSENAEFAEAVQAAGMTFIGPNPTVIRRMGDKTTAKEYARAANIPVLGGAVDAAATLEDAKAQAKQCGYPILLKAVMGGGGKGMRRVEGEKDLALAFEQTQREAMSSFSDPRVFIEKYVSPARHIEVQILADHHGGVVTLGERDCSLQRRHQKVIEEAPAPNLSTEQRRILSESSARIVKEVGYDSVGTVEYIMDPTGAFYFLEMNTRLQVEHPVTEEIFGIDLVEEMIRVAAGAPLKPEILSLTPKGHAIEARLYAENPFRDFLPASGLITKYLAPHARTGLRLDMGIVTGEKVSIHYDPMLGKLIAYGASREEARVMLIEALNELVVDGVQTNRPFLIRLLEDIEFQKENMSTERIGKLLEDPHFLKKEVKLADVSPDLQKAFLAAGLHQAHMYWPNQELDIWAEAELFETLRFDILSPEAPSDDPVDFNIKALESSQDFYTGKISLDKVPNSPRVFIWEDCGKMTISIQVENRTYKGRPTLFSMSTRGIQVGFEILPKAWRRAKEIVISKASQTKAQNNTILSPMPGLIRSLMVTKGQNVCKGDTILIIEAMKMENILRAENDGVVDSLMVKAGDTVSVDQPLLSFG